MQGKWYFLILVAFFYVIILFFSPVIAIEAFSNSLQLLFKIIPALALVFFIMLLINLYVNAKTVKNYLGRSRGRWLIALASGVISMGPIYVWYPLLGDLHKKGIGYGVISTFLYARAVKPFLLPVMVAYFGLVYTVVLSVIVLFAAFLQGIIFENMERWL
ncbi:MAG: permease [Nanoarchaeota archaeon]